MYASDGLESGAGLQRHRGSRLAAAAARRLKLTQPTLSRQIAALETLLQSWKEAA
ncbi:MAG: LysR family transcriptional regulator [Hyphomicrobiales bacterium]|nr:LysR family transcriptional regulator [Hyphomicrobiales bacterium]